MLSRTLTVQRLVLHHHKSLALSRRHVTSSNASEVKSSKAANVPKALVVGKATKTTLKSKSEASGRPPSEPPAVPKGGSKANKSVSDDSSTSTKFATPASKASKPPGAPKSISAKLISPNATSKPSNPSKTQNLTSIGDVSSSSDIRSIQLGEQNAKSSRIESSKQTRLHTTNPAAAELPSSNPKSPKPSNASVIVRPPKSWLTRKVEASPTALKVFMGVAKALGYGTTKQVAGRRAFVLYERVCAVRADEEREFWMNDCHLPPTFQSWFTITNLHIWLLTVRLRALPVPQGTAYIQALIDHFFLDIEDRIRAVLQPPTVPSSPYTFNSPFYVNPNASKVEGEKKKPSRAPDRLVTKQMKIFKEQWAGMGLALDLGLVKGDAEMAGAVWRNLLGARGAQGIAYPTLETTGIAEKTYRRSVNLVGGLVVDPLKIDVQKEEATDDHSGVHDFLPEEADLYVRYPETMLEVVGYIRRELKRLEAVSDAVIVGENGELQEVRFGRVKGGQ